MGGECVGEKIVYCSVFFKLLYQINMIMKNQKGDNQIIAEATSTKHVLYSMMLFSHMFQSSTSTFRKRVKRHNNLPAKQTKKWFWLRRVFSVIPFLLGLSCFKLVCVLHIVKYLILFGNRILITLKSFVFFFIFHFFYLLLILLKSHLSRFDGPSDLHGKS